MVKKSERDETERLPIKIDNASNGEYWPEPLEARLQWVRRASFDRATDAARRLGVTRRDFLRSTCGAATVLLALNETACGGGSYALPAEAATEPAAAKPLTGDEFIFDVQVHHVSTDRPWYQDQRPNLGAFLGKAPKGAACSAHWTACYARDVFMKEVFLDSDTSIGVLSALWGMDEMNAIVLDEMAVTRERVAQAQGAPRLLIHGLLLPRSEAKEKTAERMRRAVEAKIAAWKLYPVWSSDGKGYRLDDPETGLWTLQEGVKAGVPIFAVHKGLPLPGNAGAFTSAIDVGPAARAVPQAKILVYHSGYDGAFKEGPFDPGADKGVDTLIRGAREAGIGKGGNVYAELGSVWREVMKDPDQAAHVLGKLLVQFGEDNVLWGTDAIWYGSPQEQIQAFRAFQISREYQERFGYPELTPTIKAKVFGLNAARVYGVDVAAAKKAHRADAITGARAEYANDPCPSHQTYGPRSRRQMAALLRDPSHH
jgi:uncharacterized protein